MSDAHFHAPMPANHHHKQEAMVYVALWLVLFIAPGISIYLHHADTLAAGFPWHELLGAWKRFSLFLIIFLLHNYLLAPLIVYRQKRLTYFALVAVLMAVFVTYQCADRPKDLLHGPRHELADHRPPELPPFDEDGETLDAEMDEWDARPPMPADRQPEGRYDIDGQPPLLFGQQDVIATIILVLMLGMNLAVKLYFKQRHDQRRLDLLEKENLEQQLEYLKYQINPHFLMNTLNNIHALVDIEPEQAKKSIVELSRIMRFVLYEGSKQTVPLGREIDFLQNYITLMRMRYTDKVRIQVDIPTQLPDREIPPLMLITFVENAFKHGVSYRQESFIEISIAVGDSKLRFSCRNSKIPQGEDHHGGVGLQNVKKRLDLIYGTDYKLRIEDQADTYNILLEVPL